MLNTKHIYKKYRLLQDIDIWSDYEELLKSETLYLKFTTFDVENYEFEIKKGTILNFQELHHLLLADGSKGADAYKMIEEISPYEELFKKLISKNGKFKIGKYFKNYIIADTQKECYEFFYENPKNKGFYRRAEGQEITKEEYELLKELENE